ncbi:helix-turn-helix transcriptional regulator [Streptomyces sp. NPDC059398]|uniref:helix-turn-helix transcriptional regulator n=1 Tax=Streptomyces sp. NPDC059398 TaxID=3346820 RepID=UPI00369A1337
MPATPPDSDGAGRSSLGAFIRSRRERLSPADAGVADTARRRTPGLRREEVAVLSGVSLSWYTWLEQGRDIKVSRQVLGSLARALRLSVMEEQHLYRLAGELPPAAESGRACPVAAGHLQAVLDALNPNPSFLLDQHWDILGWNRAETGLFTDFSELPEARRNMLWMIFGWGPARELMTDWEQQATLVLAQFRMTADEHPADPRFGEITAELRSASPEFARYWERHEVAGYQPVLKRFQHPRAGALSLRQSKLIAADDPRIHLVTRLPVDPQSAARLPLLLD